MDATESPLSTSPSPSSFFSPQRHFYLAVDRLQFKMETLVDLLGMAGRRPCLPMVVCCSTRDELDAVCSYVPNLSSYISVSSLYSDLSEADRARVLDNFRQATVRWNRLGREEEADMEVEKEEENKSQLIVVTDACLPLLASSELPVSARILINYELPNKKETYMRRMAACLSADGIVISMVVGGEVVILKSLEESSARTDPVSWSAIINGYGLHGDGEEALALYSRMKLLNLRPDKVTYTSILSACSHAGLFEQGLMVFGAMVGDGILPGVEHYGCMVDLLGRTGRLDEAYEIVKNLPTGSYVNALESVLGACLSHGNYSLGEEIGRHLLVLDGKKIKDCGPYVILHNIYAAAGKWVEANNVRMVMQQKQFSKDPGFSFGV